MIDRTELALFGFLALMGTSYLAIGGITGWPLTTFDRFATLVVSFLTAGVIAGLIASFSYKAGPWLVFYLAIAGAITYGLIAYN